jgi:hypothetical protein
MQVRPPPFAYGSQQLLKQCASIAEDILNAIRSFSAVFNYVAVLYFLN